MKRLFTLLAVACILAALLVVPAMASETVYQFEMMPSASLLPVFEVEAPGEAYFYFDGYLPEGEYDVLMFSSSESFAVPFDAPISIVYDESFGGCPASLVETSISMDGAVVSCSVVFIYVEDDSCSLAGFISLDGSVPEFTEDFCLFLDPVEASADVVEESTLKHFIIELFGPYEQRTETITETLADGSTVTYEQRISGIAGLDYEWIASVALFALVLLSFFRLLGGLIKQ